MLPLSRSLASTDGNVLTPYATIIGPNPGLSGGDIHLAEIQSAKQTVYAEKRRRHALEWFAYDRKFRERKAMSLDFTSDAQLLTFMRQVEGCVPTAYKDSMGIITIGIGRNIGTRPLADCEIMYLYANDMKLFSAQLDANIPWWRSLNDDSQRALLSLCFNMGWDRLNGFKNFLWAMQEIAMSPVGTDLGALVDTAHAQLQASEWWGQVGQRGPLTLALIHV